MIPRMPRMVHGVAAVAALLCVPYYASTHQEGWVLLMFALAALNALSACR